MFIVRQSSPDDLEQILEVAKHLNSVNLPASKEHLTASLNRSSQAFEETVEPSEREYLFVLEEVARRRIVGASMIYAQHGTKRSPHVYFTVLKDERYSETIDRYFVHEALRLGYNYDGPTEIGGLILLPEYRGGTARLGKLLSFVRFVFVAMHRSGFRDQIVAELMPPLEPDGTSVLWKHLGKRFTGLRYQEADLLSKDNKEFVRALFPHSIIYTALLPEKVRQMIGQVGPNTRGVEKMLRRLGFRYAKQIDPFDGGPHFKADTDDISIVRDTHQVTVKSISDADASRPWAILAVEQDQGFRATGARVIPDPDNGAMGLTEDVRRALGVEAGDQIWSVIP
ncbi:MAG: arginine N-succinyltransferase [Proteobacteria bacterium]|nr:arginine N-succinyltransferase [Pseudomonadota bacterium]